MESSGCAGGKPDSSFDHPDFEMHLCAWITRDYGMSRLKQSLLDLTSEMCINVIGRKLRSRQRAAGYYWEGQIYRLCRREGCYQHPRHEWTQRQHGEQRDEDCGTQHALH
ncbi:hypothetical protein BC830DRAFT_244921 [Chytriomyces sp. MP71]|nr:hypothetical protein BC830DRAFT_244921 [Chytriomyces sp. MP71]